MIVTRRIAWVAVCTSMSACGGGGGGATGPTFQPPPTANPTDQLKTVRFTMHQPDVLEQIGAHHAYARGLSGQGVRIGIEDTIVDYTQQREFGDRVNLRKAEGAELTVRHPYGDDPLSDIQRCRRAGTCSIIRRNSQGDNEAPNRWVQAIVRHNGWATRDDSVFILDEHYREDEWVASRNRWREVPTPYGGTGRHGTIVASVAAGARLGVAPRATIIPVVRDFSDDQRDIDVADAETRDRVERLAEASRRQYDAALADDYRTFYTQFDIINRSYGTPIFDRNVANREVNSTLRWYRRYLPQTAAAILQEGTSDRQKTILVHSAGNEGQPTPSLIGNLPFYIPQLRGHSLTVVATDPRTGRIAGYSNRCGRLPRNWDTTQHGRHFCLAAPGTVRGLVPDPQTPGRGTSVAGLNGTSYAAPLVSGSLALLKEHFRGTRSPTQIVRRVIDTANRTGRYADRQTYGAGHLDLAAALAPVGSLNVGQSVQALPRSRLQTPAAFGSLARRVGPLELAAFDEQDFPFWVPLSGLLSTPVETRGLIHQLAETSMSRPPALGLEVLGQHWLSLDQVVQRPSSSWQSDWRMGLGPTSVSLAHPARTTGWGYGLSYDHAGYLGAQTSGAFGSDLRSRMVWTSRVFERALGKEWFLKGRGTLAYSRSDYADRAIFSASSVVLSALSLRVGTARTSLTVEQPLHAESGIGTFRIENGRIERGWRLYDLHQVPLRPSAREWRFVLRRDRKHLGGKMALEVHHSVNAGHVPDVSKTGIGWAYLRVW